jgi:predicted cytidylate kinase
MTFMPVVTLGGLPGSGTTTAARRLKARLGLRYIYTGQLFRDMALKKGMSLEEFGRYVTEHPEVDLELEMMQVEEARRGDAILEGRVTGLMLHREGVEAFKVWIEASPSERAKRVASREKEDLADIVRKNTEREANEAARYLKTYGFDLADLSIYDLVIDNTHLQPPQVSDRIVEEFLKRYPDFKIPSPEGEDSEP